MVRNGNGNDKFVATDNLLQSNRLQTHGSESIKL